MVRRNHQGTNHKKNRKIGNEMSEQYHQIEHDLGIETYASPKIQNPGFSAVLKAKFSDFVVHEVDPEGNHAVLKNLEYVEENCDMAKAIKEAQQKKEAEETASLKKAKLEESSDTPQNIKKVDIDPQQKQEDVETEKIEEDPAKDVEQAHLQLSKIVSEEVSRKAMDLLLFWINHSKNKASEASSVENNPNATSEQVTTPEKNYIFPLIEEKLTRTQIHKLIKGPLLHKYAVADTIDGKIRLWPLQFKKLSKDKFFKNNNNNSTQNKRKRSNDRFNDVPQFPSWPKDRPKYTKFVLYKENCDTNTALKDIIRLSNRQIKPNTRFNVAGMKDKRGITSQYCTVFQIHPNQILSLNHYWYDAKSTQPYKKNQKGGGGGGSSRGGTSLIKVGNFSFTNEDLRLGKLTGNRFDIALRNVDITPSSSESITNSESPSSSHDRYNETLSMLEKSAKVFQSTGFINYFGMQRFGKNQDTHKVGIEILKGNFDKAVDIIMCIKSDEPQRFRRAKQRWLDRFTNLPPSNEEEKIEEMKKHEEQQCAKAILHQLGRFMTCEISLMRSLSRKPREYKTAFRCIQKNLQLMFLHAVQSYIWNRCASFRIEKCGGRDTIMEGDLVMIEDKCKAKGGSGTSGRVGKVVKLVTEEDVSNKAFDITNIVLPLPGSRVQYPTNSTGKFYDVVLNELGMTSDMWKQTNREFSLGGDYRYIICKPSDITYDIKRYTDPKAPLLKTDLMHIQGNELSDHEIIEQSKNAESKEDGSCSGEKNSGKVEEKENTDATNVAPIEKYENKEELLGLVIGFTLPPSSYATIALRELMKRPTCSAYQSKLSLYGRCEGNLARSSCIKTENGD